MPAATAPWPMIATEAQKSMILSILDALEADLGAHFKDKNPTLADGSAGRALFMGYLSKLPGKTACAKTSLDILTQAVARGGETPDGQFFGGFPGIAWAVDHLQQAIYKPAGLDDGDGGEDSNEEVDEILLDLLDTEEWETEYDLIGGLVGFGVYALERIHRPTAKDIHHEVLRHLENLAVPCGEGLSWASPSQSDPEQGQMSFNLGLAHGVPGVLLLLAAMAKAGVAPDRCKTLLEGGMTWLLNSLQDPKEGSYLDYWQHQGDVAQKAGKARIAWCYGDLGASLALWQTGQLANRQDWQEQAVKMAKLAAERPFEETEVADVGLCHGSGGNMVLFLRHYYNTGEPLFLEVAKAYLEHAIATRSPKLPFAGYAAYSPTDAEDADGMYANPYKSEPGLLEGAAGVGLSLLAALGIRPDWDHFMMLSLPQ